MNIAATRVGTESIFVQCIAMATMARPILCSFHFYYFVATPSELPGQMWDYQQPTCKISSSSKIASEVQVDNLSWGACIKIFVVGGLFSILYEAYIKLFVEPVLNSLENLFVVEPVLKCCSSIATPAAHHLLGFQLKAKTHLGAEVAKVENSKVCRYWKLNTDIQLYISIPRQA